MSGTVHIIGVLDDGIESLGVEARAHLAGADLVIGGERLLALVAPVLKAGAERRDLGAGLTRVPGWIEEALAAGRRVAVVATGDPLCHGIGRYLISRLGASRCTVIPNLSTLQLAFARLGLAWQGAAIRSVHSRDAGEWHPGAGPDHGLYPVVEALRHHDLVALFTSPENGPARIARLLLAEGLEGQFTLSVAQRLRQPGERIERGLTPSEATAMAFADPNVVILERCAPGPDLPLFGLDDDAYLQRKPEKGLITKREARALSLALLGLRPDSIVWDIGAGSGSVGLEAARLCPRGFVFAIEKNEADFEIARRNRHRMGATNHRIDHGRAPAGLDEWPDPDAVFVGGSGGELEGLIETILTRLRPGGRLVMNFVTLENLARATAALERLGADWEVTQLQASRSRPVLDMHRLAAQNPVWIVHAGKGGES